MKRETLLVAVFVCLIMTAISWSQNDQGQWRFPGRQRGNVTFSGEIVNKNSQKCMDVEGSGGNVIQNDCRGTESQSWDFMDLGNGEYAIVNSRTGNALAVAGGGRDNGDNIESASSGTGLGQRWRLEAASGGWYRLVSVNSRRCADVERASRGNRANIHQWHCDARENQLWRIPSRTEDRDRDDDRGGGWGRDRGRGRGRMQGAIVSRVSGKCMDVSGSSNSGGARIVQWDCGRQMSQEWRFVEIGRNEYRIENRNSRKVLDVASGDRGNDAAVQQIDWNGSPAQRWRIERSRGDWFQIVNVNSGRCLDVSNRSRSNGARVVQFDCRGAENQQWRFER